MKANKYMLLLPMTLVFATESMSFLATQNTSPQKPYGEWTISDVEKLLTDSPWAQTRSKGVAIGYDIPILNSANAPPSPESVTLRLRSALPIRQALLRLRQLKAKYDKMNAADRAAFDNKNKPLIDCPACDDNYVVALGPGPGRGKGVPSIFQNMSLAEAKLNVQLENERGERRELVHFTPPKFQGDEAVFFFSRFNERSEPLLNQNSKKLIFTFNPKIFGNSPVAITKFESDVSKMMLNGTVEF